MKVKLEYECVRCGHKVVVMAGDEFDKKCPSCGRDMNWVRAVGKSTPETRRKAMIKTVLMAMLMVVAAGCGADPIGSDVCGYGTTWNFESEQCVAVQIDPALCGNGVIDPGEGCDDGDTELNDWCPSGPEGSCKVAFCGDGYVWNTQTFSSTPSENCDGEQYCDPERCRWMTGYPGGSCTDSNNDGVGECEVGVCNASWYCE